MATLRPSPSVLRSLAAAAACALALACNNPESAPDSGKAPPANEDPAQAEDGPPEAATAEDSAEASKDKDSEIERFVAWLPKDIQAASYDRMRERFDPDTIAVVFGIPPKAADLIDERQILDDALGIAMNEDAQPDTWLAGSSMAFTTPLSSTPYFLRSLTKSPVEVEPLLEASDFTKNTIGETHVWLPTGSCPWRVVLLDEHTAAFLPADIPGAGLEPLLTARGQENSSIEDEMTAALGKEPGIRLVLLSGGPLISYDFHGTIAQVQFVLRDNPGGGLAGQIVLAPVSDLHAIVKELNDREHPEENQQVQGLIEALQFEPLSPEEGGVAVGQLVLNKDQLKHFRG